MTVHAGSLAYIGLGSNLGDPACQIRSALSELERAPEIRLGRVSTLRWSDPVGVEDQPRFLNGVAEIETSLEPVRLLDLLLAIETRLGRKRERRWGPRAIDLDLLLHGHRLVTSKRLTLPHPRLTERRFVLEPLAELCPRRIVPGSGQTVRRLLQSLPHEACV